MRNILVVLFLTSFVSYYGYALVQYGLNGISATVASEDIDITTKGTGDVRIFADAASINDPDPRLILRDEDNSGEAHVQTDGGRLLLKSDPGNGTSNSGIDMSVDNVVEATLDGTGFGIGITPTKKLYVQASANSDGFYLRNSADSNDIAILEQNSGGNGELRLYTGGGVQNVHVTGQTGDSWFLNDLGLGLTNPIYRLDVSDTAEIVGRFSGSNSLDAQIRIDSTGSGGDEWRLVSAATGHATFAAGSFGIRNSDTGSSVEIDSAGKIDDASISTESTWTPVLKEGVTSLTAGATTGVYTKIGNVVFITCNFENIVKNSGGGALTVEGLPFTVRELASGSGKLERLAYGTTSVPIFSFTTSDVISLRLQGGTSSAPSAVTETMITGGNSDINISGFYYTSD